MTKEQKKELKGLELRYDYILETHTTPDFVEIVGSIGGDIERCRVYKDGMVVAK